MITRGIVVDINKNGDKLKVRVPILDGIEGEKGSTTNDNLEWASTVCFSGIRIKYQINDVVVVGFEDNNLDTPIVLGHLNLLNKDMPSRVEGSFMDLESGALEVIGNSEVRGSKTILKANSDGISFGGLDYSSLSDAVEASESSVKK